MPANLCNVKFESMTMKENNTHGSYLRNYGISEICRNSNVIQYLSALICCLSEINIILTLKDQVPEQKDNILVKMAPFLTVQVNLCQKLFFLQNMGRTCCVQKLRCVEKHFFSFFLITFFSRENLFLLCRKAFFLWLR